MNNQRTSDTSTPRPPMLDRPLDADTSSPEAPDDREPIDTTEPDPLELLSKQLREFRQLFWRYVSARTDLLKLSLRSFIVAIGLAALGFVAVSGLIVAASSLLVTGVAEGLSELAGGRPWFGKIITGLLLLIVLSLALYYGLTRRNVTFRKNGPKS